MPTGTASSFRLQPSTLAVAAGGRGQTSTGAPDLARSRRCTLLALNQLPR